MGLFKLLVILQENAELHLATKIRSRHIHFFKEKMKVKLAAQTLSESVAKALTYSSEQNFSNFQNTNATSEFCKKINDIFDVLNTRNFLGKTQFKRPLYLNNELFLKSFISSFIEYLSSLQTKVYNKVSKSYNLIPIINSGRKTGFNGLIVCLRSLDELFYDVLKSNKLEFILTYKVSQDHIEMFFFRYKISWWIFDNPTANQFEAAYKRLLINNELVTSSQANCISQDTTVILSTTSA